MGSDLSFAERLARRAELLGRLRAFFSARRFVEVETPLMDEEVIPELHIEPFAVEPALPEWGSGWLQASPEMAMKVLLASGCEAIYQVTRSFRGGERGRLHRPEFTLVEWYRKGDDLAKGMDLLAALTREMFGVAAVRQTTYHDAFVRWAGVAPHTATCEELAATARRLAIVIPSGMAPDDRDGWLNLLLAMAVEPQLGRETPELLYDYPASQAALARLALRAELAVSTGGTATKVWVAERFELYFRGVELANGYHELTDAIELRARLREVNEQRAAAGRRVLPLPERLLRAMESPGLPSCAGCALGFDRLAMLVLGQEAI